MSESQNKRIIESAFKRFNARRESYLAEKFETIMRLGLDAVLEAHEMNPAVHHHNIDERDTLGWAIFHDGTLVKSEAQDKGPITGNVLNKLEAIGSETKGWVGIVMSEMTFNWYRVDWEIGFLNYSVEEIKRNFKSIFKPIET